MMTNKSNPKGTQRIGANSLNLDVGLKFTPTEKKDRTVKITAIASYLLILFKKDAINIIWPNV